LRPQLADPDDVDMTIMMEDVKAAVRDLVAKLDGGDRHEVIAFSPQDFARPYVEIHGAMLHWVVVERGRELERRTTSDLNELLHWVALDATRSMAGSWELGQRWRFPAGRDTRIGWLAKQIELLRRLDAQWAEQLRAGIPTQCPGVRLEDVDAHPLT
jgi:hypothetical protein